jgi:hypothetical protein
VTDAEQPSEDAPGALRSWLLVLDRRVRLLAVVTGLALAVGVAAVVVAITSSDDAEPRSAATAPRTPAGSTTERETSASEVASLRQRVERLAAARRRTEQRLAARLEELQHVVDDLRAATPQPAPVDVPSEPEADNAEPAENPEGSSGTQSQAPPPATDQAEVPQGE